MEEKLALEIPTEPEKTGVKPEQEKSTTVPSVVTLIPEGDGLSEYRLSTAIRDVVDKGIRGQAGMLFLQINAERIEHELNRVRAERDLSQRETNNWKEKYYQMQERCAVLVERAKGIKRFKILQNAMVTLGALMCGGSIKYIDGPNQNLAIVVLLVGIGLMAVGWFYTYPNNREEK